MVFIHKNTHEFRYYEGRMSIINMYWRFFTEIVKGFVLFKMIFNNILSRGRNKKVLLLQSQNFTFAMVVCRVKNLWYCFTHGIFGQCSYVVSLGKQIHIDGMKASWFPKSKFTYALAAIARQVHIIGNCFNLCWIVVIDMQSVISPVFPYCTVKFYYYSFIGSGNKPYIRGCKPVIRQLCLPSVYDFLLKKTKFIFNGITCCRIALSCQRIHKTCRKSAKSSVAKTRVFFNFI